MGPSQNFFALLLLLCATSRAAVIGVWNQDEPFGDLIDRAGGHQPATLAPAGSVEYSLPGVPNGTYGSIVVAGAAGTSIGYGPSASDDFFVSGTTNVNPVMNIDRTGSFTVMSWINPAALDIAGRTYRPITTGGGAGADGGWGLGLRINDLAGTNVTVRFTNFAVADNDSAPFSITFGQWIHIAATYSNGAINYYLNGNLLAGADNSLFNNDGANARLVIGARLGGNDTDQVNGRLDGVRVYDQALSETQIREEAALSVVPEPSSAGLIALGAGLLGRRRRQRGN